MPPKDKVERKRTKVKNSFTARIVNKMPKDPLSDDVRNPDKIVGSTALTKAGRYTVQGAEYADNLIGGSSDLSASFIDFAEGGKDRDFSMVGKSNDTWGDDASLQSYGVPIVSAVFKSIKCLVDAGKYIKDMVEFARDNKIGTNERGGTTTKGEKMGVLEQTLEMFLSLVDAASSIINTCTASLGIMPIIGAIVGCIGTCISFAGNLSALIKSSKSVHRMKKQRHASKEAVLKNNAAKTEGFVETKTSTFRKTKTDHIKSDYGEAVDVIEKKSGEKESRKRSKRLDEKTKEMRKDQKDNPTSMTAENEKLLRDLEDYDVAKELTSANAKRVRQGVADIIFQDAAGIATSLAALDPTGLGAGIGASISTAISVGYAGKNAVSKIRQSARNHGLKGADRNKSTANKKARRHNLAVIMYDRLHELKEKKINLDTANEPELNEYRDMEHRIQAMGVAGSLYRATLLDPSNAQFEMLQVMRKGFYREND